MKKGEIFLFLNFSGYKTKIFAMSISFFFEISQFFLHFPPISIFFSFHAYVSTFFHIYSLFLRNFSLWRCSQFRTPKLCALHHRWNIRYQLNSAKINTFQLHLLIQFHNNRLYWTNFQPIKKNLFV